MTENRDFFITRCKAEHPMFMSVFRALPADRLDYRPHERSNAAGGIVWLMVQEHASLSELLDTGDIHWSPKPEPATLDQMVQAYERSAADLDRRLAAATDTRWTGPGRFMAGGKEVFGAPVQDIVWWILFDLIHHRGQLTAYIRPMGGKVPAVYGPSADTA